MEKEELDLLKQAFASKQDVKDLMKAGKEAGQDQEAMKKFIDHLSQCETDDCAIHRLKDDLETKAFVLGYLVRDQI